MVVRWVPRVGCRAWGVRAWVACAWRGRRPHTLLRARPVRAHVRRSANTAAIEKHDASIAEAREKFGDVEVYERQKLKAEYLTLIGDKDATLRAYSDIATKSLSTGQKIDIVMAKARLALAFDDWADAKARIAEAKECVAWLLRCCGVLVAVVRHAMRAGCPPLPCAV